MTLTIESRATAAWLDPEFWPPRGLGCWGCHVERPVVHLGDTALGFNCLAKCFPDLEDGEIADWLIGQAELRVVWAQGAEERERKNWESYWAWVKS